MKSKKAAKRLNKIEILLSNIIQQFPGSKETLGELDSAKAAVLRAKDLVNSQLSAIAAQKTEAKAQKAQTGRSTAAGNRRASAAKNKRAAAAKRKGMSAVAKRPLSKTA